jgi:hypothetical protein
MIGAQDLIDNMLRGVMISAVNRAVFERKPIFSMGTVNQGVRLGVASTGYDLVVKPTVKQVFPQLPLPNGK